MVLKVEALMLSDPVNYKEVEATSDLALSITRELIEKFDDVALLESNLARFKSMRAEGKIGLGEIDAAISELDDVLVYIEKMFEKPFSSEIEQIVFDVHRATAWGLSQKIDRLDDKNENDRAKRSTLLGRLKKSLESARAIYEEAPELEPYIRD